MVLGFPIFLIFIKKFLVPSNKISWKKKKGRDFPGAPVVKNLPAKAGGHRFDPWSRN